MKKENNLNVNFKEMLQDPWFLSNILNGIKREPMIPIKILSTYQKEPNRSGVIFTARKTETGMMQKIIIDAIEGEPNIEQIRDLTYGSGENCDKRILFYTLKNTDHHKNQYRHENEMVRKFAKNNNVCRVETLIVNVSLSSDNTCNYKIEESIDINDWTTFKRLPSKLEFDKAVFKVFYNQTDRFGGYEHDYMNDFDGWFSGTYWSLDLANITCEFPVWTEDGLYAQAVSRSKQGKKQLLSTKENKNLKDMFKNRETFFEKDLQGNSILSIKLWDRPLSYFTKSSSENKERIAEFLRPLDHVITEFWDLCPGDEEDSNYIKKHLSIPEDAFKDFENEILTN